MIRVALCVCLLAHVIFVLCVEVDECRAYGSCAQYCTNTPGSFTCSCASGYTLKADGRTCKANGQFVTSSVCVSRVCVCVLHVVWVGVWVCVCVFTSNTLL